MKRQSAKLVRNGQADLWLGTNFWSKAGGPRMWRDYNAAVVGQELDQLAGLGMTVTRSFFYWPDFMPTPDALDEVLVARYGDFLDQHASRGMRTIPTFIVGHMSGQNWDPAWRAGRDIFSDVWFVARQAWYVRELTKRFAKLRGGRRMAAQQRNSDLRRLEGSRDRQHRRRSRHQLGADPGGRDTGRRWHPAGIDRGRSVGSGGDR